MQESPNTNAEAPCSHHKRREDEPPISDPPSRRMVPHIGPPLAISYAPPFATHPTDRNSIYCDNPQTHI